MEAGKKFTTVVAKWKILTLIIFTIHACLCLANAIVGGIIFYGFRTANVAAAADGLRYTGHLLAMLIGIFIVIGIIIHWGAAIIRWIFILELVAFVGQFFAWMLDANSAARIRATQTPYKLAIASSVAGVFISFMTLYLALGLFFNRQEMSDMVDQDD
jgi:hypothetical protein